MSDIVKPDAHDLLILPGFINTLIYCINETEMVQEYDRLTGSNLSLRGTPIDLLIDEATGRLDDELREFIYFIYDCVYTRVPSVQK